MTARLETRTCVRCHRTLPREQFYASGHGNGRRRTCRRCLRERGDRDRRTRNAPVRHQRFNARGEVWCNRCQQYRHRDDFKHHPSRPGVLWSYCRPCTREIDRERYAARTSTVAGAVRELERANARKRDLRARRAQEREEFVQSSIRILRRRGFTKAEICRLADVSMTSLLAWERGGRRITWPVEERFMILVMETRNLPLGEPVSKRRLPHPDYARIHAQVHDRVVAIPVRSRWKQRSNVNG